MDEEILLIIVMVIVTVMIGVAVKLHFLSEEALRIIKDRESLIEEGYLERPSR